MPGAGPASCAGAAPPDGDGTDHPYDVRPLGAAVVRTSTTPRGVVHVLGLERRSTHRRRPGSSRTQTAGPAAATAGPPPPRRHAGLMAAVQSQVTPDRRQHPARSTRSRSVRYDSGEPVIQAVTREPKPGRAQPCRRCAGSCRAVAGCPASLALVTTCSSSAVKNDSSVPSSSALDGTPLLAAIACSDARRRSPDRSAIGAGPGRTPRSGLRVARAVVGHRAAATAGDGSVRSAVRRRAPRSAWLTSRHVRVGRRQPGGRRPAVRRTVVTKRCAGTPVRRRPVCSVTEGVLMLSSPRRQFASRDPRRGCPGPCCHAVDVDRIGRPTRPPGRVRRARTTVVTPAWARFWRTASAVPNRRPCSGVMSRYWLAVRHDVCCRAQAAAHVAGQRARAHSPTMPAPNSSMPMTGRSAFSTSGVLNALRSNVLSEHVAQGAHDHGLVEREVATGDRAVDRHRVEEATGAVGAELASGSR